ncbi:MAG: hypothetical protein KF832_26385 [Caldilineaceae bacterium]|nr:hypothetical protein [Caldilineaceae bacterium]
MATILFTTCERWPNLSPSDQLVATALAALGHQVFPMRWQADFAHFAAADLIVLRAHWDYHYDLPAFTAWLEQLTAAALPVYNPPALVRWNLTKHYLFDLQTQGVAIPATVVLAPTAEPHALYQQQSWEQAVIKPIAGASGHLVERVAYADLDHWQTHIRTQRADDAWLLQAFVPEIQQAGELSLVFIAGEFSHAFAKVPQPGEFRINSQYQGQVSRVTVGQTVVDQAQAILQRLPVTPLYARVDGVITQADHFCLIELELNEPGLGYQYAPEQAARFAAAIHTQWLAQW